MDRCCVGCECYSAMMWSGIRNCYPDCVQNKIFTCYICMGNFTNKEICEIRYNGKDIYVCEECYDTIK